MASLANAAAPAAAWQRALGDAVSSVGELLGLLGLESRQLPHWSFSHAKPSETAARDFPLRVPRGFVARMRRGDPADPLLLQVLPTAAELVATPGFTGDPLAESDEAAAFSPLPGVLHKYRGRALLLVTGACGVHCRYCFRRHFPYAEHAPRGDGWGPALAWLASNPGVEEVILSGGDPLAVGDEKLARLVAALDAVPHLRRLRVHTRMPVVLPERVDAALLGWLGGTRLSPVVVLHANHARELDGAVEAAIARLRAAGATVLNQAVLLAGVNDSVAAQCELSRALFAAGALPYYLHLLDRVAGAAHFEVPEARARELLRDVMAELPGYLVPRLVREVPGAPYKVPLDLDAG
ncbi:MAG TPA: EF-P beta-lysylation protein EpmB [Thermoanaerobaculia bacterium]|nr:EF-P beta-lysylation protein EpmB [Thermoanaerobaculia bacterium]